MNWDRVEGNWKQFNGNVKEQWGKVQQRHGVSRDEEKKQLTNLQKRMSK